MPTKACLSLETSSRTLRLAPVNRRTPRPLGERNVFMGWRRGELWLDTELWLPEGRGAPALAGFPAPPSAYEAPPGLAASRRRRDGWERRRHARRARASAIVLSPA